MRRTICLLLVLLAGCGSGGGSPAVTDEDAQRIGVWQGTWQNRDAFNGTPESGPVVVTIDRPANTLRYQGELTDTATGKTWTIELFGYDTISNSTGQTLRFRNNVSTNFRRTNPLDPTEPEKLEIRTGWNPELEQVGLTRGSISMDLLKR